MFDIANICYAFVQNIKHYKVKKHTLIAKDDELGRKLQDADLRTGLRTPKKQKYLELNSI